MSKKLFTTCELCYIALFAAVIAVSAWMAIPAAVPFTLQTLAVFGATGLLGTKCGIAAVITYVLLGAVGLPVFSGFSGGIGVLANAGGGFIIGFIPAAAICGIIEKRTSGKPLQLALSMSVGMLVCYAFGCAWFCLLYKASLLTAITSLVLPFVIFDGIKIALAVALTYKMRKYICLK